MVNKKIKFEDDCGGLKPLPIIKKKSDKTATKRKSAKGSKNKR